MFMAASSATRYLNTYGIVSSLMFLVDLHCRHLHRLLSCDETAASSSAGLSNIGDNKLPHLMHICAYKNVET